MAPEAAGYDQALMGTRGRSGADGPHARPRPRLGAWRTPRWRDPAFWAAVGITAAVFAIQVVLAPDRSTGVAWAALALRLLITWVVISALIRIRVGLNRGLVRGFAEAQEARAAPPGGRSRADDVARAGGRLAGRALRAYKRR
jgi:hypothetical protein